MRTKNSILNFVVSFFPWILLAIIGFVKIKLFVANFGSELNGLVQIVGQIFTYVGLAELGFGSAITYKFYKLLVDKEKNKKEISSLFNGSIKIFKKIGFSITVLGLLIAVIAPQFIQSNTISKSYMFAIIVLNSIDLFFIYVLLMPYQTILNADQKRYRVNLILNAKLIIFRIIEILLISLRIDYLLIVGIGIVFNLISSYLVMKTSKKNYPWLDRNQEPDMSATKLTKDVFAHKMFKIIFDNTDSILLSFFKGGLVNVSIYGAYHYIVVYLRQILTYIITSPLESFGNLFASKDSDKAKKESVFNEFLCVSLFIGVFLVSMFYISAKTFVTIWLGNLYTLDTLIIALFSIILFYDCTLRPISIIAEANGKYKETKKFILFSAITNLVLSIALVKSFGIAGVLFATALSQATISSPCYVNYIYKNILEISQIHYYKKFLFSIVLTVSIVLLNKVLINTISLYNALTYLNWFKSSAILAVTNLIIIVPLFYTIFPSFRMFLKRIKNLRRKK